MSVRCLRLSLSGSTRECLPSIWISQRSSSWQIPSSRGSGARLGQRGGPAPGAMHLRKPPRSGMWYIDDRALVRILVDDPPRCHANRIDDRMIAGGVDGHLGIGTLKRLGPDPAQQSLQRLGISRVKGDFEDLVVLDERVTLAPPRPGRRPRSRGRTYGRSSSASIPRSEQSCRSFAHTASS